MVAYWKERWPAIRIQVFEPQSPCCFYHINKKPQKTGGHRFFPSVWHFCGYPPRCQGRMQVKHSFPIRGLHAPGHEIARNRHITHVKPIAITVCPQTWQGCIISCDSVGQQGVLLPCVVLAGFTHSCIQLAAGLRWKVQDSGAEVPRFSFMGLLPCGISSCRASLWGLSPMT